MNVCRHRYTHIVCIVVYILLCIYFIDISVYNTQGLIGKCTAVAVASTISRECEFYDSCGKLFRSFHRHIFKRRVHFVDKSQWKFYYWSPVFRFSSNFFSLFLFLLLRSRHRLIVEMKEKFNTCFKNLMKILKTMYICCYQVRISEWCVCGSIEEMKWKKNNLFFPHHFIFQLDEIVRRLIEVNGKNRE